ncbi:heme-binding protein 2-like [Vigna unguiculata]|uniref:heme-binding protein 2-like n=1 Tax=Vigna unguiculata TaxID=3917 RepID=UPI0010164696|nr:heme-binding protein 2-like [Vigna unguiculata]
MRNKYIAFIVAHALYVNWNLPQSCKQNECPTYTVVEAGNGYEIRKYDSPVWISTPPIQNKSFVGATTNGFIRLFSYARGKNNQNKQIKLTAPVTSEVSFNGGKPSIVVSFFVPLANQNNPALANGLSVKRWKSKFVAVKQFGGFVTDSNVGRYVASLKASLGATKRSFTFGKSFIIAQYDPPFKLTDRVNEVWFLSQ